MAAGLLIDVDPELAMKHVMVARRLAARLSIVREAVAETAYAAGEWQIALSEYRTLRRMRGGSEYLPVIADCERALGRPRDALQLIADADMRGMEPDIHIEVRIVEAGAREDMGQRAEADRILRQTIANKSVDGRASATARARLRYAYADFLERGQDEQAERWFTAAAKLDQAGATDAAARVEGTDIFFDDDPLDDPDADVDGLMAKAADPDPELDAEGDQPDAAGEEQADDLAAGTNDLSENADEPAAQDESREDPAP